MTHRILKWMAATLLAGAVCAVALILTAGAPVAADSDDYVQLDGRVNTDKLPDTMMMVDSDGEIVLDESGNPVLLDSLKVLGISDEDALMKPEPRLASDNSEYSEEDGIVTFTVSPMSPDEVIELYGAP